MTEHKPFIPFGRPKCPKCDRATIIVNKLRERMCPKCGTYLETSGGKE